MKKTIIWAALILLAAAFAWAGWFYWRNLRGASLVLRPPDKNIVELFEESQQTPSSTVELPLKLPPGFRISLFAKDLPGARMLSQDNAGNLLVSLPESGRIVALPDRNGDRQADQAVTVVQGLNKPHGLAFRCYSSDGSSDCKLFVAETDQLAAYDYDQSALKAGNKKKLMDLPDDGGHWTRTVKVGPDDRLYLSIGSSCNVCEEKDERRAKLFSLKPDGTDLKEVARGLRNSVFFEWSYVDGRLWATEMGRDLLGDDLPPDEINIIETGTSSPRNYGWPLCYGKNVHDTAFDKNTYIRNPCQEPTELPSHIDLPAHSAPLGLAFVPEEGWPQAYWYNLLVAYHGSWNRSEPTGYKVARLKLDAQGKYLGAEDFITGWLAADRKSTLGRPVDLLVRPGGTAYLSDDFAGVVYLITYSPTDVGPYSPEQQVGKIMVRSPQFDTVISSPLKITGQARGNWFFEASFPIKLYDKNGQVLGQTIATAQSDWMTTEFVPFTAELSFATPTSTSEGKLVLEKDNPSGLPEHDDRLEIKVQFESGPPPTADNCRPTGCSGQVCSDQDQVTTCEFLPEYECYRQASCARQSDGRCGWTETPALEACLKSKRGN